jgi:hypothetical protein
VSGPETPEERRAMFRVVAGEPSDSEVVALAMVIAGAAAGGSAAPAAEPDRWSAPATSHRRELAPGPGAWKTTYWPR